MSQRVGGAVLLLVAVIILVLAQVSAGPDVPGAATRAPLPLPPPVGYCLSGPDNIVVPCDQPHEGEVTFSWTGEKRAGASDARIEICNKSVTPYLALIEQRAEAPWIVLGPQFSVAYLAAPTTERVGLLGWGVCAIRGLRGETYSGTARGGEVEPTAYGACFTGSVQEVVIAPNIDCSQPHDLQLLATSSGFVPDDPTGPHADLVEPLPSPDKLASTCLGIAAERLQTPDPTYGGQLDVEAIVGIESGGFGSTVFTQTTADGTTVQTEVAGKFQQITCTVGAAGAGVLTDTLIGNSTKPLPIQ